MKVVKVVCGIIWKEGKIFIARRKTEKSLGGYWEFPGGKLELTENAENALKRELQEELGMKVKVKGFIASHIHHYDNFSIDLLAYTCEFINASFSLTDHDAYEFISPSELKNYQLAPADLYFLPYLSNHKLF